ncbi:MAG: hypothetical protein ACE14O_04080 [Candidatus Cloacimonadaceae bacterium]
MLFLKSLLFIAWNIVIGICLVELIHWLLFNKKSRSIFGLHIPLTPGFVVQKRDWIFNKAREILNDYLDQAENYLEKSGYLAKWEQAVYEAVMEKLEFIAEWRFLPASWKQKIREAIANAAKDIAAKVLRILVPRLIEQLQIENRIDEFDEKFSMEVIRQYYNRYVHKYLMYIMIGLNFLIGITNMVLFLIIA